MIVTGRWPNTERDIIEHLKLRLPQELDSPPTVGSERLESWQGPMVVVERIPGGGLDDITAEHAIDVTVYAASRSEVWELVRTVEPLMLELVDGHDDIRLSSSFGLVAYKNPDVRRAVATYGIDSRPQ